MPGTGVLKLSGIKITNLDWTGQDPRPSCFWWRFHSLVTQILEPRSLGKEVFAKQKNVLNNQS